MRVHEFRLIVRLLVALVGVCALQAAAVAQLGWLTLGTNSEPTTFTQEDLAVMLAIAGVADDGRTTAMCGRLFAVMMEADAGTTVAKRGIPMTKQDYDKLTTDSLLIRTSDRNCHVFHLEGRIERRGLVVMGTHEYSETREQDRALSGGWLNLLTVVRVRHFWLPGYSEDGTHALVVMFDWSGPAENVYSYELQKQEDRWRIIKQTHLFTMDFY